MNRSGRYQPERQLLGGVRTHQESAPFHGALSTNYLGERTSVSGHRGARRRGIVSTIDDIVSTIDYTIDYIVSTIDYIVSTKVDIQSLTTPNVTRDGCSPPRYTVCSAVTYWSGVAL